MNFKPKLKTEHGTFRVRSGFAWFPKTITQTKSVWLEKYTRHEVFYGHKWYVCDPETEMVNWPWDNEWQSFAYVGLDFYIDRQAAGNREPVKRKKRVQNKTKLIEPILIQPKINRLAEVE